TFLGQGVVVAWVVHPERRGVRHHPARVERGTQRADLGPGDRARDRANVFPPRHRDRGKFMQSTKISSKSGCAASETCSIRPATASACARSVSDTRQSCAPSEAALPTY